MNAFRDNSGDDSKHKLDPRILTAGLIVGIIEFELFSLVDGIIRIAKQDAWICIILGSLIISAAAYLLIRLAARFPGESPFQYGKKIWGKPIAFLLGILYLLYWGGFLALISQDASMANRVFFLKSTPPGIPMLILAIAAVWLAAYGLTDIIRFFQLNLPLLILPLILVFLMAIRNIDLHNFQPVLANGVMPVIKGTLYYLGAMQGFEIILFLGPFLKNVRAAVKPALAGIYTIIALSLVQLLTVVGIMGTENVEAAIWPGISAISVIQLPGFPVERFELFLTVPWIIGVFTTICLYTYFLVSGITGILGIKKGRGISYFAAAIITLAAYMFPSYAAVLQVRSYYNAVTPVFLYLLPIAALLTAFLRKKRGGRNG